MRYSWKELKLYAYYNELFIVKIYISLSHFPSYSINIVTCGYCCI